MYGHPSRHPSPNQSLELSTLEFLQKRTTTRTPSAHRTRAMQNKAPAPTEKKLRRASWRKHAHSLLAPKPTLGTLGQRQIQHLAQSPRAGKNDQGAASQPQYFQSEMHHFLFFVQMRTAKIFLTEKRAASQSTTAMATNRCPVDVSFSGSK